jgi:hypothetical protein
METARELIRYIRPEQCRLIVTSSFWPHAAKDRELQQLAQDLNGIFVDIGKTSDDMMALGRFWHQGVACHPGDKGMEMIAEKLFSAI